MNLLESLTAKERKIYEVLRTKQPTSIDVIVNAIGSQQKDSVSARKAAISGIKTMGGKLAAYRLRIKMVEGGRGRGAKGVFLLEAIQ